MLVYASGWVYDFLKPQAVALKVAHPEMLKAKTAAKKKNDRADAEKIADLLRVNLLPECHMLSEEIRELRRILRYRNHIVRMAVNMQNKVCWMASRAYHSRTIGSDTLVSRMTIWNQGNWSAES